MPLIKMSRLLVIVLLGGLNGCSKPQALPASPSSGQTSVETPAQSTPAKSDPKATEKSDRANPAKQPEIVFTDQIPLETAVPEIPIRNRVLGRLQIGDPAPPLLVSQWVVGTPVGGIEPGHIYVVEFWATWCGPCRTSMPHLSTLQEAYPDDVTIVGVTGEETAVVGNFLMQKSRPGVTWSETVKYRLARDQNGQTNAAYMQASGQGGIPTAFIVGREGRIEWIGHPMHMDVPLAMVVTGDWDREIGLGQ